MTDESEEKDITSMDEWYSAIFESTETKRVDQERPVKPNDAASLARESLKRLTMRGT